MHIYRGGSMLGTFRPGDCLTVEPVPIEHIRPGDVVAFLGAAREDGAEELVAHRVIAITPGGLVTRGDNNPHADAVLVTAGNLLGRVTHFERDGVRSPVRGGRTGLWQPRLLYIHRRAHALAVRLGGPYRWLRSSGLLRRLWQPAVIRIRLATENGPLVKYLCGQRTVARWWPEEGRFECQKPYDLVIPPPDGLE
jgi:signal peptidase I